MKVPVSVVVTFNPEVFVKVQSGIYLGEIVINGSFYLLNNKYHVYRYLMGVMPIYVIV